MKRRLFCQMPGAAGLLSVSGRVAAAARRAGGDAVSQPLPQWPSPTSMAIDPEQPYGVTIETSLGGMTAELYPTDAPNAVNNVVLLARAGFGHRAHFLKRLAVHAPAVRPDPQ